MLDWTHSVPHLSFDIYDFDQKNIQVEEAAISSLDTLFSPRESRSNVFLAHELLSIRA